MITNLSSRDENFQNLVFIEKTKKAKIVTLLSGYGGQSMFGSMWRLSTRYFDDESIHVLIQELALWVPLE